jgi:hypothetical protein
LKERLIADGEDALDLFFEAGTTGVFDGERLSGYILYLRKLQTIGESVRGFYFVFIG